MDMTLIVVALALLGLCFGSFVNALVWRVRKHRDMLRERSECTHCHHVLAWYDLVPVLSYISLGGKCRYCHKSIEDSPIVELVVALLFVVSYYAWPFGALTGMSLVLFILWLAAIVILVALAVYDLRWQLLPDVMVFPLIGLGLISGIVRFSGIDGLSVIGTAGQILSGIAVISGLYWALYMYSKGRWIGFGDVKLGIFMGAVLGWQAALLALFLANLLGVIVIIPGLVLKKLTPKSRVPFGPFLITTCLIALLWGSRLIDWYLAQMLVV